MSGKRPLEQWRRVPIEGVEWYEVSDAGRVRNTKTGCVLKGQRVGRDGDYRCVAVSRVDGWHKRFYIHELVLGAFVGPRPDGFVINHLNCRKDDNRLANLEYATPRENVDHAVANGRYFSGRKTTSERARWILALRKRDWTLARIATVTDTSFGVVQRVCSRPGAYL